MHNYSFWLSTYLEPTEVQWSIGSAEHRKPPAWKLCQFCLLCCIAQIWSLAANLLFQGGTDGMGYIWAAEPDHPGNDFQRGASNFFMLTVSQIDKTETEIRTEAIILTKQCNFSRCCWPMTNKARPQHWASHGTSYWNINMLLWSTQQSIVNLSLLLLGASAEGTQTLKAYNA